MTPLPAALKGMAAGALAGLVAGAGLGWSLRDGAAERARLAAERAHAASLAEAIGRTAAAARIGETIGAASAARQVEIRHRTLEIIREVPTYVTVEADRQCSVPFGFVRLHDAAAGRAPAVPDPAAPPHDAPSGVALSAVAGTVAANYGDCRADAERLSALQAWVRAQAEAAGR